MEYTDYYVARGTPDAVRERLIDVTDAAVIVDMLDEEFVPFVTETSQDDLAEWDWLLRVYDAEGAAWGFEIWLDGDRVGAGEWGENGEWGIDAEDNGFDGDPAATAVAFGTTESKLSSCWHAEGVEEFCEVGFPHQYMLYPRDLPDGVHFVSDF